MCAGEPPEGSECYCINFSRDESDYLFDLMEEWRLSAVPGWNRTLSVVEARIVLAALERRKMDDVEGIVGPRAYVTINIPARCLQRGDELRGLGVVSNVTPASGKSVQIQAANGAVTRHMDDLVVVHRYV